MKNKRDSSFSDEEKSELLDFKSNLSEDNLNNINKYVEQTKNLILSKGGEKPIEAMKDFLNFMELTFLRDMKEDLEKK